MPKRCTLATVYETVARSLREFGYPDCAAQMIRDTHEAMKRGDETMPHGIIGMFAQRQLEEAGEALNRLTAEQPTTPEAMMRTRMVEERIGENMGPIDWSHATAKDMPPIWREAEAEPDKFVFGEYDRVIYAVAMYDGWPYWTPRPAVYHAGVLGPEWSFFDSYGVHPDSIKPRRTT